MIANEIGPPGYLTQRKTFQFELVSHNMNNVSEKWFSDQKTIELIETKIGVNFVDLQIQFVFSDCYRDALTREIVTEDRLHE